LYKLFSLVQPPQRLFTLVARKLETWHFGVN